jgi:hypothetical protein
MRREWDWPPEHKHFERVEVLPPRQPQIDITIRHRYDLPQRLILTAAIVVVALLLLRSPGALLLLAVMAGPQIAAIVFGLSVAAVVTIWRRRRPF